MGLTNKNISDEKMKIIDRMLEKDEKNQEVLNSLNLNQFYSNYFTLLEEIR